MAKKKESYEELMEKLDNIIKEMEKGEVSLEKSMKNYEEGIKISNKMNMILKEAEGKIKILTENGEKDYIEVDE
ncbi:exodeoxyribonuclease 7 small subunit [Clostridium homopropionicum DSM 5847]|uniref:Exodeoxyribonuclease 7 small subunit n=1 Tax=Clostridium homopropionicum DSM 5847 TaxID=1121318 RepID=A0A0L6ZDA8_9CLOT|nr:exodeoxyribonuclease VII small subunit [Clostridium homopropionicum]KOA20937.1 exodeoxyribonuclease 7 small subunit [Clostridium homopropionicum DSM 5847]SFG01797.1 Exodeoxyribonuclease VII small subunit [Clostridium homopropionicum]